MDADRARAGRVQVVEDRQVAGRLDLHLDRQSRHRFQDGFHAADQVAGAAVRVFGRNQVSTYVLIGLGEDPDELVAGAAKLIDRGVYPFVVPFRPMAGTLARRYGIAGPAPSLVRDISERVAKLLQAAGMLGADQKAGCAACGACGILQAAGG